MMDLLIFIENLSWFLVFAAVRFFLFRRRLYFLSSENRGPPKSDVNHKILPLRDKNLEFPLIIV